MTYLETSRRLTRRAIAWFNLFHRDTSYYCWEYNIPNSNYSLEINYIKSPMGHPRFSIRQEYEGIIFRTDSIGELKHKIDELIPNNAYRPDVRPFPVYNTN